jgi:hypothetical protein
MVRSEAAGTPLVPSFVVAALLVARIERLEPAPS